MVVEFIGSTGAGKTSLISKVHRRLAQRTGVTTSFDLIATPLGLLGVTNPTAQNIIQELVGLPFFVHSLNRHRAFLVHILRVFSRNTKFSIHTINNLRSLERKIGMYELIQRYGQDRIVLVDEGPILAAHMFVFADARVPSQDIATLAALLPLPDLVVYVKAPVDILVSRTLQRPDPPREMGAKDPDMTEKYVKMAISIFDELVEVERIRIRLLVVDNPDLAKEDHDQVADNIAGFILDKLQAKKGQTV